MPLSSGTVRIPKYRPHKPSGLGVVRLGGRDIYLGKHGTPASQEDYRRVIAEWIASSKAPIATPGSAGLVATDLCVNQLLLAYLSFAKGYYVKHDRPTGEYDNMKDAVRPLAIAYGNTAVAQFFGKFKTEWEPDAPYATRTQAKNSVFEYIEVFYNRTRPSSVLSYVSPEAFEAKHTR